MSFFSVAIGKEMLRFTAAHFIAFRGFREPLHGHTYQAQVTVSGPVRSDGYVVDFLVLKKIAEEECARLHFRTLVPRQSDCLTLEEGAEEVKVRCEDGTHFVFPRQDVCLLPIVHTGAEAEWDTQRQSPISLGTRLETRSSIFTIRRMPRV